MRCSYQSCHTLLVLKARLTASGGGCAAYGFGISSNDTPLSPRLGTIVASAIPLKRVFLDGVNCFLSVRMA